MKQNPCSDNHSDAKRKFKRQSKSKEIKLCFGWFFGLLGSDGLLRKGLGTRLL